MKEDLKAVGVYIATLVGAGFASGSEIVFYFVRYGKMSIMAIFLASFLFSVFAVAILRFSRYNNLNSFSDFLIRVFGERLSKPLNIAVYFFIFAVFCAMISGSAESLFDAFGLKRGLGALLTVLAVFFVLIFDSKGLSAVDGIISILIFIGILCISFYLYTFREIPVFKNESKMLASGAMYAGYNMLTAGGVLAGFAPKVSSPRRVGAVSGVIIFVLLSLLWGIISIYYGKIPLGELPMLTICRRHGDLIYFSYFAVLFMAMLSTAISNAYLLANIGQGRRIIRLFFVSVSGFLMSGFPLDFFVDKVYRAVGILGFFIMAIIFIKNFKKSNLLEK